MGINVHVLDTALPTTTAVLSKPANPAALGANLLVPGVAGKKIRLLAFIAVAAAANSIKLQSDAIDITGLFALAANGQVSFPFNAHGWCETTIGGTLNINLSAATAVGVQLVYITI